MVSIMMSDSEIIAVVQAHKEGKKIEFTTDGDNWYLCENPMWNFTKSHYRVDTEPRKPREWWMCNGYDKKNWIVIPADHGSRCHGEMVHVREVIE